MIPILRRLLPAVAIVGGCGDRVAPNDPFSRAQLEPTERGWRYRRPSSCASCAPCDCACMDTVGEAPFVTVPVTVRDGPRERATVDLSAPFFVARYPLTNRCRVLCEVAGACEPSPDGEERVDLPTTTYSSDPAYADYPATRLRWATARALCLWLGGDLPTVTQYRYAMRGPEDRYFPWGDGVECGRGDYATITGNSGFRECSTSSLWPRFTPVDAFPSGRGPFGSMAVSGAVNEWLLDYHWDLVISRNPRETYESRLQDRAQTERVRDPTGPTEAEVQQSMQPAQRSIFVDNQRASNSLAVIQSSCDGSIAPMAPECDISAIPSWSTGARCAWRQRL
jgi:formylglycine-generating enzyme required for sulfatase activity